MEAKSAWSEIPAHRFKQDAFYHPNSEKPGFFTSQGAHFLPGDIYAFDAAFFHLKPDEVRAMDPQHRLLLECAFEAAESAGMTTHDLVGSNVGVFAANDLSDYASHMMEDLPTTTKYMALGVSPATMANRLSYLFGITGPSMTVDAACTSSSVAIHLACQSILAGDCTTAFVGGAKLLNSPNMWTALDTLGYSHPDKETSESISSLANHNYRALSPEGRCFSYDSRASGFGKGEGGACIIIKRLSDAVASGDPIRAVIRSTATSHSGRHKASWCRQAKRRQKLSTEHTNL